MNIEAIKRNFYASEIKNYENVLESHVLKGFRKYSRELVKHILAFVVNVRGAVEASN